MSEPVEPVTHAQPGAGRPGAVGMSGLLALAAGSVLDAAPEAAVRAAAAAGFDALGLRSSAEHALDVAGRRRLRKLADDLGVVVHDLEVVRLRDAGSLDEVDRLLEAAADLGAARLLVVSDHPDPAVTEELLAATVERAAGAEVIVGLEYMAWTTPSDPAAAAAMAARTGARVIVDLLHHVRIGAGAAELHDLVASGRLGWVQLCDAPLAPLSDLVHEARNERRPPGEGELPLRELLQVVPDGTTCSVEVQSDVLAGRTTPAERAVLLATTARRVLGTAGQSPSSTG
jgi:sugar phosphate isomerase/epimerase